MITYNSPEYLDWTIVTSSLQHIQHLAISIRDLSFNASQKYGFWVDTIKQLTNVKSITLFAPGSGESEFEPSMVMLSRYAMVGRLRKELAGFRHNFSSINVVDKDFNEIPRTPSWGAYLGMRGDEWIEELIGTDKGKDDASDD